LIFWNTTLPWRNKITFIFEAFIALGLIGMVLLLWMILSGAASVNEPGDITGGKE
jgi:hypothetical protein